MKEDQAAFCAECQAVDPWVEENDERICRQCGYIQDGLEAAKFHHEDQYVNPLVDIYLKNPAFQNPTGGPSKRNRYGTEVSQRVQSRVGSLSRNDSLFRLRHADCTLRIRPTFSTKWTAAYEILWDCLISSATELGICSR
jgi:hypothetical protein